MIIGGKKHIANPVLGLLFGAVYMTMITYILPVPYAFIVCLLLLGVVYLIISYNNNFKPYAQRGPFYISAIGITCPAILWIFANKWIPNPNFYIVFGEMVVIVLLMFVHIFRTLIKAFLVKRRRGLLERVLIDDFFHTATLLQYGLTTHIFALFIYERLKGDFSSIILENILYCVLPSCYIVGLYIFQFFRTNKLIKKLKEEEWLPIINEDGDVTGKIAKAVSVNMKNRFLHPVVRVALTCRGKIFLQSRDETEVLDAGKIDHPFEKYILFKHEVNIAVQNIIKRILGRNVEKEPKFLFKYTFENEKTKRLIFLFVIEVDDEFEVKRTGKITGKFWTVKQIDEEFSNQLFSECFELEYEYIKHVLLLCDADEVAPCRKK